MDTTQDLIGKWRQMAADEAYFSASRVQSGLFDLYGVVTIGEARRLIEAWLTLTIQRDLFSGTELLELLHELESVLGERVS